MLDRMAGWLYRRGEDVLAVMLFVMFVAFLAQIVLRYLTDFPIGWTSELSTVLWIWLVLWGAAFVLREEEEIRFDLIYSSVPAKVRRVMFLIAAAGLLVLYGMSFPAVADYVLFMKVQKSAYLKIRFDFLFGIYIVFVIAVIARYIYLSWRALRGEAPGPVDPTSAKAGV